MTSIRAGNAIFIEYRITDRTTDTSLPFDPTGPVTITLRDPFGVPVLSGASMSKVKTGRYAITWQSLVTSQLGVYTAEVTAVNGVFTAISNVDQVFTLVS